jgi:hypothetical protein
MIETMATTMSVITAEPNPGETTFSLNSSSHTMHDYAIHHFSSEMG